eukprot:s205_g2.t3
MQKACGMYSLYAWCWSKLAEHLPRCWQRLLKRWCSTWDLLLLQSTLPFQFLPYRGGNRVYFPSNLIQMLHMLPHATEAVALLV